MTTTDNYKRFAVRCLDEARNTSDEPKRAFLIEMAQEWQKLAEQSTANDNLRTNPIVHEPDRGD
jgi:hypothetical protein